MGVLQWGEWSNSCQVRQLRVVLLERWFGFGPTSPNTPKIMVISHTVVLVHRCLKTDKYTNKKDKSRPTSAS